VAAIPTAASEVLSCSQCGQGLSRSPGALECSGCGTRFPIEQNGSIDLRLKRPKTIQVEFRLGTPMVPAGFAFTPLKDNPTRVVDLTGKQTPWHLSSALLSYFPRARSSESLALDLGCGTGLHRDVCEAAGFQWVGLDYTDPTAPILGDGHALPFASESFEFVLSMAVLEHIRYPFVVAREVMRVLKPGGVFIGSVAFLEPFHGDSFYHHTHLGTYNTLHSAGFVIDRVAPNAAWSNLQAQATMGGLFPRMPERLARAFVWPLGLLHKLWWRAGRLVSPKANETLRLLTNTGSFEFVARKP
jgi:SAM-dependent methyltransferase